MRLTFRCLPGYEAILPQPVAAAAALPGWLREMPARQASAVLGGATVRTLKQCPPFLDALSLGVLMPLATDVTVAGGTLSWDWDPPRLAGIGDSRAPIGVHVPEQAAGAPLGGPAGQMVVKFTNFWTIESEPGWSVLFVHPLNREDLPFRTLSGLVDCDRFADGLVHFPALWVDAAFEGVLPAGTPVAQAIAVPRQRLDMVVEEMDGAALERHRAVADALGEEAGIYRKRFRDRGGAA